MDTATRYVVPIAALVAATLAYYPARRLWKRARRRQGTQLVLEIVSALPLVGSGTMHLLRQAAFTSLLWPWVPRPELVIILTGIPEWAGAIGLFLPRTRRAASVLLTVFMIAIFPANIYVAGQNIHGMQMPSVPARWAMQVLYIWLLLYTGEGTRRRNAAPAATPARDLSIDTL